MSHPRSRSRSVGGSLRLRYGSPSPTHATHALQSSAASASASASPPVHDTRAASPDIAAYATTTRSASPLQRGTRPTSPYIYGTTRAPSPTIRSSSPLLHRPATLPRSPHVAASHETHRSHLMHLGDMQHVRHMSFDETNTAATHAASPYMIATPSRGSCDDDADVTPMSGYRDHVPMLRTTATSSDMMTPSTHDIPAIPSTSITSSASSSVANSTPTTPRQLLAATTADAWPLTRTPSVTSLVQTTVASPSMSVRHVGVTSAAAATTADTRPQVDAITSSSPVPSSPCPYHRHRRSSEVATVPIDADGIVHTIAVLDEHVAVAVAVDVDDTKQEDDVRSLVLDADGMMEFNNEDDRKTVRSDDDGEDITRKPSITRQQVAPYDATPAAAAAPVRSFPTPSKSWVISLTLLFYTILLITALCRVNGISLAYLCIFFVSIPCFTSYYALLCTMAITCVTSATALLAISVAQAVIAFTG